MNKLLDSCNFEAGVAPVEVPCSTHPDAPHGFDRNSSHSLDRYVCDCEGWVPPEPVAQCTNSDSWNCKYCNKTATCEALKDPRNFGVPIKPVQAERKEVGRLESELREWSSVFGHFGESPDDIGNMINEDQDRLKAENKRLWEAEWLKAAVEFNRAPEDAEFGPGHFVFELASENDRLRAQLAQQQVVPEWVPVSERLPDIAQEVIVHTEFDGVCAGVLDSYGEWFAPCSEYKLT